MNKNSLQFARAVLALTVILAAYPFTASQAAPINYGDFNGTTVMYIDVTETANTAGDTEPLFYSPNITGNLLDFDPKGFAASAGGGSSDLTDGQLNFMLRGQPGNAITSFTFNESGDYVLFGTGTAATGIFYALSVSHVSVSEIDGVALASPVLLSGASASGGDNLGNGSDAGTPWGLSLTYDVNAALNAAGVLYNAGATRLDIVLDNNLGAISETSTIASIAKKDFRINVGTEVFVPEVPIPGALVLMLSGLAGLIAVGRRRTLTA
ncbi:MAG: VPLPA-CTERM sorting domain-containing protein [Gammaproteobacteria bacterium]